MWKFPLKIIHHTKNQEDLKMNGKKKTTNRSNNEMREMLQESDNNF